MLIHTDPPTVRDYACAMCSFDLFSYRSLGNVAHSLTLDTLIRPTARKILTAIEAEMAFWMVKNWKLIRPYSPKVSLNTGTEAFAARKHPVYSLPAYGMVLNMPECLNFSIYVDMTGKYFKMIHILNCNAHNVLTLNTKLEYIEHVNRHRRCQAVPDWRTAPEHVRRHLANHLSWLVPVMRDLAGYDFVSDAEYAT